MEYETTARTRAGSVESIVDPDHDSPMQFGARVIELGTKFLLDTLSHAAVRGWAVCELGRCAKRARVLGHRTLN